MAQLPPLAKLFQHLKFVAGEKTGSLWLINTQNFTQQLETANQIRENCHDRYNIIDFSFKTQGFSLWDTIRAQDTDHPQLILARDFDELSANDVDLALNYLNTGREVLLRGPFHLVLFILPPTLPLLIRRAGDFWSWHRGMTKIATSEPIAIGDKYLHGILRRYYFWLKTDALKDERTRLQYLKNAEEAADFAWFPRKGKLNDTSSCDPEEIVGTVKRQLIIAPFGYYKAKEVIAWLDQYLEKGSREDLEQPIPIVIDVEQLNTDEALFSENNLKTIFGYFATLINASQYQFRMICHGFEHFTPEQQTQALQDMLRLHPEQIIVTANDQLVQRDIFKRAKFETLEIMPIPYRWLEQHVRKIWGRDLRYRHTVYELMRIPEVRAAMVCMFTQSDKSIKYLLILHGLSPLFPIQLKHKSKYYQWDSLRSSKNYPLHILMAHFFSDLLDVYETGTYQFPPFFRLDPFRELPRNKQKSLHHTFENYLDTMLFILNQLKSGDWKEPKSFKDPSIFTHGLVLYQIISPKDRPNFVQDSRLPFSIFVNTALVLNHWSLYGKTVISNESQKFQTWFHDYQREPISDEERDQWIEMFRENFEEEIFQQYYKPALESLPKDHPDTNTRAIAATVLAPPPLPEQAIYEETFYADLAEPT